MPIELKNVLKVIDTTGFTYYLGTLTPRDIKQLTFVPVVSYSPEKDDPLWLNENADNGYQRAGETKRMEAIREFVLQRRSCVIPPVLLCARGGWEFQESPENSNFGSLQVNELAAIIDGQHRLGGLWRVANSDRADNVLKMRPIPFMIVENLPVENEKLEFVDINDNQKGVKKSLLKYLNKDTTFAGIAAFAMMEDEESVFRGRIDIQKKYDWTIFLYGAAQECVDMMFSEDFTVTKRYNPQADITIRESALDLVLKYWRTVQVALPEFWSDFDKMPPVNVNKSRAYPGTKGFQFRLLEETGIRAFSKLASELFTLTWMNAIKQPSWDVIQSYLEELGRKENVKLALSKLTSENREAILSLDHDLKSYGKAGVSAIYRHLHSELLNIVRQRNGQ